MTAAQAPVPELAVVGWLDQANPTMFTVPIVSRGWLEATAPRPCWTRPGSPTRPYSETWSYVFGMVPPRPKE
jgi:hypothetical protein